MAAPAPAPDAAAGATAQKRGKDGEAEDSFHPNVARIAIEQRRKKTDVVEPKVISEELLIDCVEDPVRPDGEPWRSIDFPQVIALSLSFKNIIEIDNLNQFAGMTTLRLDNNIIDKIQNIGHLKQLTWLDLSFNNITEIEGLEGLSNLTDLSLYHNRIELIQGLNECPKLNVLSLGHNNISDLKQIDKLRRFQNLKCVCLEGNKVCQKENYTQHVLAYLVNLKYHDYKLIDAKQRAQAQEGYNTDELGEIKERELAEAARMKELKEKGVVLQELKGCFLDYTEDLFEALFPKREEPLPGMPLVEEVETKKDAKDVEPENLLALTCYPGLKENYREHLQELMKGFSAFMRERNGVRVKKVTAFEKAIKSAEVESEEEAFELVRDFRSAKKKVFAQLEEVQGLAGSMSAGTRQTMQMTEEMMETLRLDLENLEEQLMKNEIAIQESIEEAIGFFEGDVGKVTEKMVERGGEFFMSLNEYEKQFHQQLSEGALNEMEGAAAQDQGYDNEGRSRFLGDKDGMITAINNFYEQQQLLIQNKEDYMMLTVQTWQKSFFENHKKNQYHRNRQRILDIKKVVDEFKEEIEAQRAEEDDDHYADPDLPFH